MLVVLKVNIKTTSKDILNQGIWNYNIHANFVAKLLILNIILTDTLENSIYHSFWTKVRCHNTWLAKLSFQIRVMQMYRKSLNFDWLKVTNLSFLIVHTTNTSLPTRKSCWKLGNWGPVQSQFENHIYWNNFAQIQRKDTNIIERIC